MLVDSMSLPPPGKPVTQLLGSYFYFYNRNNICSASPTSANDDATRRFLVRNAFHCCCLAVLSVKVPDSPNGISIGMLVFRRSNNNAPFKRNCSHHSDALNRYNNRSSP
jgi:hypothetical protein